MHLNAFKNELFKEHLEEAGFQYEIRKAWLHDEQVSWLELEDIDFKMEAHLDALVLGGAHALKVALEYAPEADFGELNIIVRLFCRHQLIDRLLKLWTQFDFDDEDKLNAISDALKWECPVSWQPKLIRFLQSKKKEMYGVVASCISVYSPQQTQSLLNALDAARSMDLLRLVKAILHSHPVGTNENLVKLLNSEPDNKITQAILKTLLARGEPSVLSFYQDAPEKFPIIFAIAGTDEHKQQLINIAVKGTATEDVITAIGAAGQLAGIPPLLGYLKHPELNKAAARALYHISAAPLYEEVYIAEDVSKHDLFEHELADFDKGSNPKNIDGVDYGVEVSELSVDYDKWFTWFQSNKQQFQAGKRYRHGKIYSAQVLLESLIQPHYSYFIRELAYEELLINFGLRQPFYCDDLVYKQKQQLNEIYKALV